MPHQKFQNALLSGLSESDSDLIQPHLETIDLPRRKYLERSDQQVDFVYFPDSGIASVIEDGGGRNVEVGMVGREGMTGVTAIMGAERSPYDTVMQVSGRGRRARVERVRSAMDQSASLRRRVLDYVQAFLGVVAACAAVNARNKVEERLARWLLVARDRVDHDEVELTHDLLAQMLGVRRAGVTIALQDLQSRGVVAGRRGAVRIVDREGLVRESKGAYTRADAQMRYKARGEDTHKTQAEAAAGNGGNA